MLSSPYSMLRMHVRFNGTGHTQDREWVSNLYFSRIPYTQVDRHPYTATQKSRENWHIRKYIYFTKIYLSPYSDTLAIVRMHIFVNVLGVAHKMDDASIVQKFLQKCWALYYLQVQFKRQRMEKVRVGMRHIDQDSR